MIEVALAENNTDKLRRCYHELASLHTLLEDHLEAANCLDGYLRLLCSSGDQDVHCKFMAHKRLRDLHSKLGDEEQVRVGVRFLGWGLGLGLGLGVGVGVGVG